MCSGSINSVSGVECVAGVGKMCIGSGEGVVSSERRGSGLRINFGALPLLPFYCPPQSAMVRLLHFTVYNAPPLWCQLGTLPLDEHAADW